MCFREVNSQQIKIEVGTPGIHSQINILNQFEIKLLNTAVLVVCYFRIQTLVFLFELSFLGSMICPSVSSMSVDSILFVFFVSRFPVLVVFCFALYEKLFGFFLVYEDPVKKQKTKQKRIIDVFQRDVQPVKIIWSWYMFSRNLFP